MLFQACGLSALALATEQASARQARFRVSERGLRLAERWEQEVHPPEAAPKATRDDRKSFCPNFSAKNCRKSGLTRRRGDAERGAIEAHAKCEAAKIRRSRNAECAETAESHLGWISTRLRELRVLRVLHQFCTPVGRGSAIGNRKLPIGNQASHRGGWPAMVPRNFLHSSAFSGRSVAS